MKKIIIRSIIALVALFIIATVVMALSLNWVVRTGVQKVGGSVTKVDVKLRSVNLSLLSGAGEFKGLVVGNPPGFGTPWAMNVGTLSLAVEPRSLLSDKVIVRSVLVDAPEITFETDLRASNLGKLLENVTGPPAQGQGAPAQASPPAPAPQPAKTSRKFQVDDFLIKDAKVHISVTPLGRSASVTLPEIHLQNLGTGPEGITAAELTQRILQAIEKNAAQAASASFTDVAGQAMNTLRGLTNGGTNSLETLTKGIRGLLKQ
jgi:hypothetical protein